MRAELPGAATIARARDKVCDKGSDKLLKELSKRLGLGGTPCDRGRPLRTRLKRGRHIHLADGDRIVFDTVGKTTTIGKMTAAELALQAGAAPKLSATAVTRARVLRHLARHHEHEAEDRAEELGMDFLRDVPAPDGRPGRPLARLCSAGRGDCIRYGHFNPQHGCCETRPPNPLRAHGLRLLRPPAGTARRRLRRRGRCCGSAGASDEGRVKAMHRSEPPTRSFKFFQVPDMWEER